MTTFPIQKALITSLPKEVLLRIFEEVYYASCAIPLEHEPTSRLADASLFPQCLAKVCKAWEVLVRSIPLFATRVMVFVDEPIVLDELKERFKASKTLLIKVFVVRKAYPETPDPLEKSVARYVVNALAPHITRCQVVVFDLLHSSSLPHITQFSGKAAKLRTLRMQCRIADADEDMRLVPRSALLSQRKPFLCPNLQYLDMHGHIFVEALNIPQWEGSIRSLSRKELTVSHIRGFTAKEFDLQKLISAISKMGHLTRLKLSDIELDHTSCLGRPVVGSIFVQNFVFEGLSKDFFTGFTAAADNTIDTSNVTIRNCQLGKITFFSSWNLTLENIDAGEDLVEFISLWDGFSLHFKNCPGIDDRLLQKLATPNRVNGLFYAQTLRQLNIEIPSPSSNISVEAFKHLVLTRMEKATEAANRDPLFSLNPLPIHSLYVSGPGGPALSLEDKIWFQERVECLMWETIPTTCGSPIIEGDYSDWDFSMFDDSLTETLIPPHMQPTESQDLPSLSPAPSDIDCFTRASPIIEGDCSDWDYSMYKESIIKALNPPHMQPTESQDLPSSSPAPSDIDCFVGSLPW